jgi:hypothetical protein
MRWACNLICRGEWKNVYRILVRKPEEQRPTTDGRIIFISFFYIYIYWFL